MDFERERSKVERIKAQYPAGTRIELGSMNDPYAPVPPGTRGTVDFVDDMGSVFMKWDNGRTVALIIGEDSFTVISRPQTPEAQNEPEESQQIGGMKFE